MAKDDHNGNFKTFTDKRWLRSWKAFTTSK